MGRAAEEILEKHGLGAIKESMATAEADLLKPGLDKLSITPSQQCTTDFNELKRSISNARKSAVSFGIKVKEWQGVPASVTGLLSTLRNETTALSDASRFFDPSKKSAVPDRMKECIDALVGSGMDFPVGMRGYYMV